MNKLDENSSINFQKKNPGPLKRKYANKITMETHRFLFSTC